MWELYFVVSSAPLPSALNEGGGRVCVMVVTQI
jgi:hypothetical protein